MRTKLFAAALASAAIIASPALAQTSWVEIADNVIVEPFQADADTVDDWDVYLADGTEIGEVEEVLGPDDQTPTALAVDFEGNAGFADRDVIIPLENFEWTDNRLVLTATAEDVAAMEEYRD